MVDARNAFNILNRKVLLHNIQFLCPTMATYVKNCYYRPSRLFVTGGAELKSSEGTTQGDLFAMATYGIGILPLLTAAKLGDNDTKHAAFADDLAGVRKLRQIRQWWDNINTFGPLLGYFPKASKSWLVVTAELLEEAHTIFEGTGVNITSIGKNYLGGFIGNHEGKTSYFISLVNDWIKQLEVLCEIAKTEPQAAYSGFVHGFRHKLTYHIRVCKDVEELLKPFDEVVKNKFIPTIVGGRQISDDERLLLSLPTKLGGLAIPIFHRTSSVEYENSRKLSKQLLDNIKEQVSGYTIDEEQLSTVRSEITSERSKKNLDTLTDLKLRMDPLLVRAIDLAQMKGASSWLSAVPLASENFALTKQEFIDAICLRYRWDLKRLPIKCPCGKTYSVDHALTCQKGGFVIQRHDRIRNLFGKLLSEVKKDVCIEPHLIPLSGEQLNRGANLSDEARLDVSARGFWRDAQRAFFDVMVFNPFAPSHTQNSLQKAFDDIEKTKKRHYNQRVIQVEHGTFTPLVFTPYGGAGREADHFLKILAEQLAAKQGVHNSVMTNWVRTKLSFELVRAALLCVRGTRVLS